MWEAHSASHQRSLAFLVHRCSSSAYGLRSRNGHWEADLIYRFLMKFIATWLLVRFTELQSLDPPVNGGSCFSITRDA